MIYGLIISAGNQKRYGDKKPKALVKIKGIPLVDINILNLEQVCDKVFVVCSYDNEQYFCKYNHITIESGFGCGDAVMKALDKLNLKPSDWVFIQWGDSIQEKWIYESMLYYKRSGITIPCVIENKPYVQIIPSERKRALFSKYGEKTSKGYHDLSVFFGNGREILKSLKETAGKMSKNGLYKNKHGNELNFLDILNKTHIPMQCLIYKDYKGFSFNTKEELEEKLNGLEN